MRVRLAIVIAVALAGCGSAIPPDPPVRSGASEAASASGVVPTPATEVTGEQPPARVMCLRIGDETCAQAIDLVREGHGADVEAARAIIVADTCPPRSVCDRLYAIDTVVVLVPGGAGGQTLAFHVVGHQQPEKVSEWIADPLPEDVLETLRTA